MTGNMGGSSTKDICYRRPLARGADVQPCAGRFQRLYALHSTSV